jgi:hypothetical protein
MVTKRILIARSGREPKKETNERWGEGKDVATIRFSVAT